MDEALEYLSETHLEFSPDQPIRYQLLSDSLDRLYEDDRKQSRVFKTFSAISIFLSCLGIFGLVSFAIERRRKEFGIRKAMGANISIILALISREFVIIILIAAALAFPVSWLLGENWLNNYAYRIVLLDAWYIFLFGGLLTLVIAMVTIILRSIRAANANPTESLRYE